MNKYLKIIFFTFLSLFIILTAYKLQNKTITNIIGENSIENVSYNVIGSSATTSPGTLSTSYSSNTKTLFFNGIRSLHLDVAFTPTTTNEYALIKVEQSNDGGITYFPLSSKSVGTTEIGLNITNATDGTPVVMPSSKVSTVSTTYYGSIDFDIVGESVRISTKSSSSTGYVYIRATGSSK